MQSTCEPILGQDADAQLKEAPGQSDEQFRLLVENVRDYALFMLDPQGRVRSWNLGAERIKGYRAEEIVGRHFACFYRPEDVALGKPDEELRIATQAGRFEDENWRIRKDGSLFWAHVVITAIHDGTGQLQGFAKVTCDVSHRKQADDALRLNEARLQALLELNRMSAAPLQEITDFVLESAVALTGSTIGYLAFLNEDESVLTMHSWSKSAMQQCAIIDKPIVYQVVDTGLWGEAVRQRRPVITNDYQAPSPLKKGYPPGHLAVTRHMNAPVFDGDRIVIVAGVGNKVQPYDDSDARQLTLMMQGMWQLLQRKRAEEALAQRAAELAALNQELEAFSYSVSHDLRAPLRSVEGFAQILLEEHAGQVDAEGRDCLQRICSAAGRMKLLIEDLLKLARLARRPLEYRPVDLSGMATTIAGELRGSAPQRQVEFIIAGDLTARGDEGLLQIVLQQLLENAWKFTGKRPAARIEFGRTLVEGCPAFYVRDNGAGFDMRYAAKLFGAFQRLHSLQEFPGTGIGLTTVERIIRRHGGRVWAEGAVDQGATFYFAL